MAGPTAQSATQLSDGQMNHKSYQTLNAMPSTQSNVESQAMQNPAKTGGNVTLSTSMNMPS